METQKMEYAPYFWRVQHPGLCPCVYERVGKKSEKWICSDTLVDGKCPDHGLVPTLEEAAEQLQDPDSESSRVSPINVDSVGLTIGFALWGLLLAAIAAVALVLHYLPRP